MDQSTKKLFTPFNIGNVTIKNRFCLGPTGVPNVVGPRGQFTPEGIEYYLERARGGFGLVYTGAFVPDMNVDPYDPATGTSMLQYPMDFRSAAIPLNEKLATYGTKAFIQIGAGVGRNYPYMSSPSEVEVYGMPNVTSPALTVDQIKQKVESVVSGAALAQASGFSGVELHAMHWGYLLDQFALAITNHRTDEYGGSLENRLRIVKEIIDGVKQVCGSNFPVTMRLGLKSYIKGLNQASLTGEDEAGRTLEEGIRICKLLEEYGFDALSVDTGIYDSFYYACPPCYMPHGHALDLYAEAKKAVNIPILAGSRMGDPVVCAKALEEGKADAFVLVRPALADPYFPKKIEMGQPEKIRTCIGCNQGCVGRYLEKGLAPFCAVNPRTYRELSTKPKQSTNPKNILIVGGGVAGMEAARTATMNGHKVELYEKSDVLGGELLPAGAHSFKHEVLKLNDWYKGELKELNIPVHLNTEATPEMIKAKKPDVVILAVGASPIMPASIPGINHEKAVSGVDALTGKKTIGQKVVIVGGGVVGCEIAMDYAMEGKNVTIVEALDDILKTGDLVPQQNNGMIRDMLKHYKIDIRTSHKLDSINDTGAVIVPTNSGEALTLEADTVVLSIGLRSNASMASELYGEGIAVYEIGSGRTPSNILSAVSDAFEVAYNLD